MKNIFTARADQHINYYTIKSYPSIENMGLFMT